MSSHIVSPCATFKAKDGNKRNLSLCRAPSPFWLNTNYDAMPSICFSLAPKISHNADAAEVCCTLITANALDATTAFVINANEAWLRASVGGYALEAEFPLFTGEELLAIERDETALCSNAAAGTLHGPAANAQRQKKAWFCERHTANGKS